MVRAREGQPDAARPGRENHKIEIAGRRLKRVHIGLTLRPCDAAVDDEGRGVETVAALEKAGEAGLKVEVVKEDQRPLSGARHGVKRVHRCLQARGCADEVGVTGRLRRARMERDGAQHLKCLQYGAGLAGGSVEY